jgi:hypothetical protein
VESQANSLAEIFWLAHSLHEPEGTHVQELGSRLPRRARSTRGYFRSLIP